MTHETVVWSRYKTEDSHSIMIETSRCLLIIGSLVRYDIEYTVLQHIFQDSTSTLQSLEHPPIAEVKRLTDQLGVSRRYHSSLARIRTFVTVKARDFVSCSSNVRESNWSYKCPKYTRDWHSPLPQKLISTVMF